MKEDLQQELSQLTAMYNTVVEFFVNYSFQLIGALIVLVLGFFVGGKLGRLVQRVCARYQLDETLSLFLAGITKFLVIGIMAVIALGKIGITIAPFVAAVGAISLGAGLAFQGLLSNYGAGLTLMVTRPFVVGDTITIEGVTGLVKEVKLGATLLVNEDEVEITIPNKHIIGEVLYNSHSDTVVELEVGIAYDSDVEQAISAIHRALSQVPALNGERTPQVGIDNFGDSSINLGIRFWAPTERHFEARYSANGAIHKSLQASNIKIPFPQREVSLLTPSDQ